MGNKPSKEISRRDAIKILAAVAGATALVNLPDKWTKPGMEVGVLPAHAQTSLGLHTLAAGASDPSASLCNFDSTVTINPPTNGIVMRYVITATGGITTTPPGPGTAITNPSGIATQNIVASASIAGETITVTWSFNNPSDGTGSSNQIFTGINAGC